jgi:hypothetical protein
VLRQYGAHGVVQDLIFEWDFYAEHSGAVAHSCEMARGVRGYECFRAYGFEDAIAQRKAAI